MVVKKESAWEPSSYGGCCEASPATPIVEWRVDNSPYNRVQEM